MALDTYQLCPCGSGKKIKFCCSKDMVNDLQKVMRAVEGEQRVAALDQINRLVEEKGERTALLALKAELLLAQGDVKDAESTIVALQKCSPHNPVALALGAILAASQADTHQAVDKLQQALESVDQTIAAPVYSAIGVVAAALLNNGDILAARGHWLMQAGMAGGRDSQPAEKVTHLNLSQEIPLLLKEDRAYQDCPAGVPWRGEFEAAMNSARKGAWLAACESLDSLAQKTSGQPAILRNIAILRGWLGQSELAVASWRAYSQVAEVSLDDAVEAEALAQLLDSHMDQQVDAVTTTYPVNDVEQLMERLLSHKSVVATPVGNVQPGQDDEPPPKGAFWLLDRPADPSGPIHRDTIPCIVGELFVHGKQTDREARLEFAATRTTDFEDKKSVLTEVLGDLVGAPSAVETTGHVSAVSEALTWRWHVPTELSRQQQRELIEEQHEHVVLNRWPELNLNVLDGKRPIDVASHEAYRVRLLAAILLLDLTCAANQQAFDFNLLRRKLDLPERTPVQVEGDEIWRLPLSRLTLIDVDRLNDEDLVKAFQRSVLCGHEAATARLGADVLQREGTTQYIDKQHVYEPLIRSCRDADVAVRYAQEAQQAAVNAGGSPARWILTELAIRLPRGEAEESSRLVQTLQSQYIQEPGIAEALYRMLVAFGVITPEGQPVNQVPEAAAAPEAAGEPAKLWTPGESAASQPSEGKSKLWVPGMD